MWAAFALILMFAVGFVVGARADDIPKNQGWVNDYANILNVQQKQYLSKRLSAIEKNKPDAPQIVVITLATLNGKPIEDITVDIGKAWRVGQAGRDNGVIIAVAPKERKGRIEVGYGLEPNIPDGKAKAVIDKMGQVLKKNRDDWNGAIIAAIDALEPMLPAEAADPLNPVKPLKTQKMISAKPLTVADHSGLPWGWIIFWSSIIGVIAFMFYRSDKKKQEEAARLLREQRKKTADNIGGAFASGAAPRNSSRDRYYENLGRGGGGGIGTTIIPVVIPSSDSFSSRSDYSSGYSSGSSSSSSDSSSSSSDSYSSGGGDFGGGGSSGSFD